MSIIFNNNKLPNGASLGKAGHIKESNDKKKIQHNNYCSSESFRRRVLQNPLGLIYKRQDMVKHHKCLTKMKSVYRIQERKKNSYKKINQLIVKPYVIEIVEIFQIILNDLSHNCTTTRKINKYSKSSCYIFVEIRTIFLNK